MIKYIKGDLFTSKNSLSHCVSSDFKMGAGIAKEFVKRFPHLRGSILLSKVTFSRGNCEVVYQHPDDTDDRRVIFNLITKDKYWQKPTLKTMEKAIETMFQRAYYFGINIISMPKIGCGLDKLIWEDVEKLIKKHQGDVKVEVYEL